MELPVSYKERMKELLNTEYEEYQLSFQLESWNGFRVNTGKILPEEFERICPFPYGEREMRKVPWTQNGYYYDTCYQPARHPYYYAGLYYIQEPSAMLPAAVLPVEPGDRILDLCAAPGGKSTELGARLKGRGILVANDISSSRAKALLKNIELSGIDNAVVVSEAPQKLALFFHEYFDKILIDAPCSGEGMFRKDKSMIKNWTEQSVQYYASLQREIIDAAAAMLKPGGMLVYSTCTFSPEEDERSIAYLLQQYPAFTLQPISRCPGFDSGRPEWAGGCDVTDAVRLWPHRISGEGHFTALLKKEKSQDRPQERKESAVPAAVLPKEAEDFLVRYGWGMNSPRWKDKKLMFVDERLYAVPAEFPAVKGLRILRSGLLLGERKGSGKKRFEPSQALAMALNAGEIDADRIINLNSQEELVIRYLKGETVDTEYQRTGWQLVCVDGYPLGWGKAAGITLKNKYYAGWRRM